MSRLGTGVFDKHGVEICAGDTVERIGLLKQPKIFIVFQDEDGDWRLDESGNRTSLVYPPLEWSLSFTYEIKNGMSVNPVRLGVHE